MPHSTVTRKGQTTIPRTVRRALQIRAGDTLEYAVQGDSVTVRVHAGTRALKGVLASKKGEGKSFARIRAIAAESAQPNEKSK